MKKLKRIAALLLCAAALVTMLCACSKDKGKTEFDKLYAAFTPDTAVAEVNGIPIRWEDFVRALYSSLEKLEGTYGEIPAWDRNIYEGVTYSDFMKDYAMYDVRYNAVIEAKAREMGISLGTEGEAAVQSQYQMYASQYENEDAFLADLAASYCTKEALLRVLRAQQLYNMIMDATYGKGGANLTQQEIDQFVEDSGFVMARIIVILSYDPNTGTAYDDVERTRRLATAKSLVKQLDECAPGEKEALFLSLQQEYNEDPAAVYFPKGYLFGSSDLSEAVYNAAVKLEVGQHSSVVSSDYGYYVILRIPIDESATPVAYSSVVSYGQEYPLRAACADSLLAAQADEWDLAAEVVRSEALDNLYLGDYLTKAVTIETSEEEQK